MHMFYWIYLYSSVGYTPKNEVGESQISVCSVSVDNTKQFSMLFYCFTLPSAVQKSSNYFTFSLKLGIISFWYKILEMVQWLHLTWLDFNLYISVVSEIKYLFICWLVIWIPSAVMSIHIVSLVFYGVFYFVNLYNIY